MASLLIPREYGGPWLCKKYSPIIAVGVAKTVDYSLTGEVFERDCCINQSSIKEHPFVVGNGFSILNGHVDGSTGKGREIHPGQR